MKTNYVEKWWKVWNSTSSTWMWRLKPHKNSWYLDTCANNHKCWKGNMFVDLDEWASNNVSFGCNLNIWILICLKDGRYQFISNVYYISNFKCVLHLKYQERYFKSRTTFTNRLWYSYGRFKFLYQIWEKLSHHQGPNVGK